MTDSDIQITVEGTPNPHAAKFVLDRDIPGEGSRSYFDPESAAEDPLAARLLRANVYYGWAIVFACAGLLFVSVGVGYYGIAVYLGPLRELHLSEPMKMVYLFTMSIIPTVPAAWLTFAEGSVYPVYDHAQRLFGISVAADQQAAGAVMKVLGGLYLWTLIAIRFFRFSAAQRHADLEERRRRLEANTLTTADVEAEFERLGPPPHEPTH